MNNGALATMTGLALLLTGLACGGGSSFDNVGACKRYVEAMNGLECYPAELDADQMCQPSLDMTPCDLATYYDCMATGAGCKDGIYDASKQADCGAPTCN